MDITYEMVFGAQPGQEIQEGHIRWQPCPAVAQLRRMLGPYHAFASLGGSSSHYNEFNRHHAGLAVDIMIPPGSTSMVTLGQHLFRLFAQHRGIMGWRGIIYQHVSLSSAGTPSAHLFPGHWPGTDHMNHIHIDWHDPRTVEWVPITTIPWRRTNGTLVQLHPKQGNRIASRISWPPQAQTQFEHNHTLVTAIAELMARRDQLSPLNLAGEFGLTVPA